MKLAILSLFAILISAQTVLATPAAVVLLRHAEKPVDDQGTDLSPKGWDRAKALPSFFHDRGEVKVYGLPVALFAVTPKNPGGSLRSIETLKYVADDLKLALNTEYTKKKGSDLAARIMNDHTLDGKLVVICWDHDFIDDVAVALGAKSVPQYPAQVFDRAWLLQYDTAGAVKFTDLPQRLLPGDSDK